MHELHIFYSHTECNLFFRSAKTAASAGSEMLLNYYSKLYHQVFNIRT